MFGKLAAFFANGQATAAVTALILAVYGVLVVAGVVTHAPDAGLVSSIVAIAFTTVGIALAFIQHTQHTQKVALAHNAAQTAAYAAADLARTQYVPLGQVSFQTPVGTLAPTPTTS
jgi:hypothetical protein